MILLVTSHASSLRPQASPPTQVGQWAGPYDWGVIPPSAGQTFQGEFSHAALLLTGPAAGNVLLWHLHTQNQTTLSYLFDPSIPSNMKVLTQTLGSNIFCSAHSFDADGKLVVVGGQPGPLTATNYCAGGITLPANKTHVFDPVLVDDGTHAPPGYYMLFVCDGSIPSVGKVVQVR